MKPDCQRFFEDPDAHASHLDTCADCQAVFGTMPVEGRKINVDALPLAPWEGASYRSWPLVLGGALTLLALTLALFAIGGGASDRGLMATLSSAVPSVDLVMRAMQMFGSAVREAPRGWQIAVVVSFVAVNGALLLLLRRAPRGIDV